MTLTVVGSRHGQTGERAKVGREYFDDEISNLYVNNFRI
ncbi:protein of unassigned function [Methylobacterium oryzae CBMB20]|uniref:Protein of unassigned function n=1 Tax=Methylobacterium oryzae CBMB20 TaxID=693986 RepID=A0A089NXF3_9HYPH|nr:protein of unassigned function [Methylobacterium oryzae CBMB20]